MASGQETYDTLWTGLSTYKTAFATTDLTSGGFNWQILATLDMGTGAYSIESGYVLPEYSTVSVLVIVIVIGAVSGGFSTVTIAYSDNTGAGHTVNAQVIQGMQELTSISLPLTSTGIVDVTAITRTLAVSGTVYAVSADSVAEKFDSTAWSAASPGL